MSWCTIESDPGVFNEMISSLGVKDVSVEEVYTLDDPSLLQDEAHGLIFLFKCQEESDPRPTIDASTVGDLFFARQTVQNACATQAILSVLLNSNSLELGNDLDEFKSFVLALDPESRGMAIGESDKIRTVHNSFARSEPFFIEESNRTRKGAKEDAFHFVAYVPFEGKVYE
jgi:ubiquitin carboxyl-terminal hydrolase L5